MTLPFMGMTSLVNYVPWLAWILLHSLWQGALAGGILWIVLTIIGPSRSHLRYAAACAALLIMVIAPIATGFVTKPRQIEANAVLIAASQGLEVSDPPVVTNELPVRVRLRVAEPTDVRDPPAHVAAQSGGRSWLQSALRVVDRNSGLIVTAWLVGVLVSLVRLLSSALVVRSLKKSADPICDPTLLQLFSQLISRLKLHPTIRLMNSSRVSVPTVVGWVRPIVLFPLSYASRLPAQQIEALMAHELAHIKRHDYLVNVLQNAVEAILFYHPVIWWISKVITHERECCSDEIALQLVSDKRLYIDSLVELAKLAIQPPQLAVAATGGSLKKRIERMVNYSSRASRSPTAVIGVTSLLLLFLAVTPAVISRAGAQDAKNDQATESKADTPIEQPKAAAPTPFKNRPYHGNGSGDAEIFHLVTLEAIQRELGIDDATAEKVVEINNAFRKELQSRMPVFGTRARMYRQSDGGFVQRQEATKDGLPVFNAAAEKFLPQLKDALGPEQFARLQQITWQDRGEDAFTDDALITLLDITKEQRDKIVAVIDDIETRRSELAPQSGTLFNRDNMQKRVQLSQECDAALLQALPDDIRDRFKSIKGEKFDFSKLRPRNADQAFAARRALAREQIPSTRAGSLWSLADHDAIKEELKIDGEQVAKLMAAGEQYNDDYKKINSEYGDLKKLSEDDQKIAKEKRSKALNVETEKFVTQFKAILTKDQYDRLQQIYWQRQGTEAFFDSVLIETLATPKELQTKLKEIRGNFDKQIDELLAPERKSLKQIEEIEQECYARIEQTLTQQQRDRYVDLLGKEFKIPSPRFPSRPNGGQGAGSAGQDPPERNARERRGIAQHPRRHFLSLVENSVIQKELGISVEVADKIRQFSEDVRKESREAGGEPSNFEQQSVEERTATVEKLRELDDTTTKKFIPKLKEILTGDQYVRLKQIYWQSALAVALRDEEVVAALSLSPEQLEKLNGIKFALEEGRDEVPSRATINAVFYSVTIPASTKSPRAVREERQAAVQENRKRVKEILTIEQQTKFEALKGKEFDMTSLRR